MRRETLPKERDYVRPPSVAGLFYPAGKDELRHTCAKYMEDARRELSSLADDRLFGIVAPHAGYQYSGYTAAHGYASIPPNSFQRVIVVSPSHREYFDGISVFSGKSYSTPLGEIEVDVGLRESFLELAGESAIESRAGHKTEHALEVQLPFLQLALGSFKLLPIVMGDQNRKYCGILGKVIADLVSGDRTLVVASSDLSHYHDYDTAEALDKVCADDVAQLDPDKLLDDLQDGRCEACGGGPVASLLYAAKASGATNARVLYHCNSGDTTGDKTGVVGYLSAVVS